LHYVALRCMALLTTNYSHSKIWKPLVAKLVDLNWYEQVFALTGETKSDVEYKKLYSYLMRGEADRQKAEEIMLAKAEAIRQLLEERAIVLSKIAAINQFGSPANDTWLRESYQLRAREIDKQVDSCSPTGKDRARASVTAEERARSRYQVIIPPPRCEAASPAGLLTGR
jgi:hypothetical protein